MDNGQLTAKIWYFNYQLSIIAVPSMMRYSEARKIRNLVSLHIEKFIGVARIVILETRFH